MMDAPTRWNPNDLWVAVGYAIAVGVWAWLISRAGGAPLPFPKRLPPPAPPAAYVLHWHGAEYDMALHPGGRYEASSGGSRWAGRWRTEGGVLVVREAAAGREADCVAGKAPWPIVWSPDPWGLGGERPAVWLERVR